MISSWNEPALAGCFADFAETVLVSPRLAGIPDATARSQSRIHMRPLGRNDIFGARLKNIISGDRTVSSCIYCEGEGRCPRARKLASVSSPKPQRYLTSTAS